MTRDEARTLLTCKASSFRTICEVHREIFEIASPEIRELIIDAFIMAKKMDEKLKHYKADWSAGFYEVNDDRAEDRERRLGK